VTDGRGKAGGGGYGVATVVGCAGGVVVACLYGYLSCHEGVMQWLRGMDGNGRFGQAVMIPRSLRELGTVA
jgi:hypothetical protein